MAKARKLITFNGEKMTKSKAIRLAREQSPKAKAKEIVDILAKEGVKVSPNLVYTLSLRRARKKSKQRRAAALETGRQAGMSDPVAAIMKVRGIAADLGGIKKLKQLVDALAE